MARTLTIKVLNGQEECNIYSFYCLSVTRIEMREALHGLWLRDYILLN